MAAPKIEDIRLHVKDLMIKVNLNTIEHLKITYVRGLLNNDLKNEIETKYSLIEKVCLALYFASTKLRLYMIGNIVFVMSKADVPKYMLIRQIISRRIGK